jgi:hypothetical protein
MHRLKSVTDGRILEGCHFLAIQYIFALQVCR